MRAYPRRGRPTVRSRMFVAVLGSLIAIGGWTSAATASSTVYLDVGGTANALAFEPTGEHAYVAAAGGLVVVDAASRSIEATVPLGGSPESIAVDPVSGHVLAVTGADLTIIDPGTASVAGTIHLSLPPGYSSSFIVRARKIAMSAALSRAFVIIQVGRPPGPGTPPPAWHLVSVDVTGGPANQISTAALGSLGDSRPTGIVVDDVSGHVYVGKAGTGILSFDAGTLASLGTINGTSNLSFDSALALDSANHRLYAGLQTAGAAIAIIDTTNDTVIGSLPATGSRSVAVDPVRGRVLVPDIGALQVFEGGALAQSVPFNWLPNLAVVDPATGDAWVTLNSGGIAVVDLAPGGTPRSGFVTSAGGDLFVDGLPYRFTGVNFYNANSDGWCRDAVDDATLDASLDAINLSFSGHGVIRAWFFQTLAVSEPSGARDWTRFDRLLREAASRGYKVIPTLADQWGECGARVSPTFAFKTEAWYTGGYAAPDPALAAAHGGTWLSYRDWVAEVVGRYKDDATVAFWQLMNEAEVNPGGAFGVCPPGDGPRDELIDFATDMSGLVKSIDPQHLLSLGTIGGGQCGTSGPSTRTSTRSRTSTSANTTTTRRTRRSRATSGTAWACVSGSAPSWASHCSSARRGSGPSMPGAHSKTVQGPSRRRSSCS